MSDRANSENNEYLRFQLGGENYAFNVLKAREVLFLVQVTPLPSPMNFLRGVINLRGSVIPVIDLQLKFNLPRADETEDTAIIIVNAGTDDEAALIGVRVDNVKGVFRCVQSEMEAPPSFGMRMKTNLIKAIARHDGQFVVILDSDQIFSEKELWSA